MLVTLNSTMWWCWFFFGVCVFLVCFLQFGWLVCVCWVFFICLFGGVFLQSIVVLFSSIQNSRSSWSAGQTQPIIIRLSYVKDLLEEKYSSVRKYAFHSIIFQFCVYTLTLFQNGYREIYKAIVLENNMDPVFLGIMLLHFSLLSQSFRREHLLTRLLLIHSTVFL